VTEVVVLSDTHMRPGLARHLPPAVYAALEEADLVLHAGDVMTGDLLEELAGFAPTLAVLGNNDGALAGQIPEDRVFSVEGFPIAMVHDSGARQGREARMRRRYPTAGLVVFGHSHIPLDAEGVGGQRLFNPGSATERRGQPHHTFGRLRIDDGRLVDHRIVVIEAG
jgi:putative phosphoesterase